MSLDAFSPFFYANLQVMFEAMQKAGTVTDTDKVRQTMLSLVADTRRCSERSSWTGQEMWKSNQQLLAPTTLLS